jgi:hypothetical protein
MGIIDKLNKMKRTLSEILKDADKANELKDLIDLWNELAKNKYKYPLVELWFANEHIRELALKVEGSCIAKAHFYHTLKEMHKC